LCLPNLLSLCKSTGRTEDVVEKPLGMVKVGQTVCRIVDIGIKYTIYTEFYYIIIPPVHAGNGILFGKQNVFKTIFSLPTERWSGYILLQFYFFP
jgi:hypothetical protein